MSVDRAREPSGPEREMWELLACRLLGVWEKGDSQGGTKVTCSAVPQKLCYWAQSSK